MKRLCLVWFLPLLWIGAARAQSASLGANAVARAHFDAGLARAREGNFVAALQEFESAYGAQPHFSVLYNIGQARSSLGRPLEAIEAFESYLALGGDTLPTSRRQEVETLLLSNRRRTGLLRILAPTDTRIWLDGAEIPASSPLTTVRVAAGRHAILSSTDGSPPSSQNAEVENESEATVTLVAQPPPTPRLASLTVDCAVPDVEIFIDGISVGRTPRAAPLIAAPGRARVRFWRAGYEPAQQMIDLTAGVHAQVACNQRVDGKLPDLLSGKLLVRVSPASASVWVDGKPLQDPRLPVGQHDLRIELDGYLPHAQRVLIKSGEDTVLERRLMPNAATRTRLVQERVRRRNFSLALGAAGLSCLGLGGGLYVWNNERFDDWSATRAQRSDSENLDRALGIRRVDDAAVFSLVLGSALALGAGWLFVAN